MPDKAPSIHARLRVSLCPMNDVVALGINEPGNCIGANVKADLKLGLIITEEHCLHLSSVTAIL